MRRVFLDRSVNKSLRKASMAALIILGVLGLSSPETVLAKTKLLDCPTGTFPGTEAFASTITLQMPFIAGETWTVGGAGSFYGNVLHCNEFNDYYATDWNRTNDDGAAVLPVADGFVSDSTCLPGEGYGCYVQIDHANGYRTLYAHLSDRLVNEGDSVHTWTLIGRVGNTGLPVGSGSHLHLTFKHNDNGYFSYCWNNGQTCPNGETPQWPQGHRPSPMMTTLGPTILQDFQSYTSVNGRVYLSDLRNAVSGWTSEFYVRNDGTESRDVKITYYTAQGTNTTVETCPNVDPNERCWIPMNVGQRLPPGVTGSAFIDGAEAASVVVETRNATAGSGYAYTGRTVPTATLYLPVTIDLSPSWLMRFQVLNTGPASANITSRFFRPDGTTRAIQTVYGVPANGLSLEFPVSDFAPYNDYYGTGTVSTAVQPLATTVHISDTTHRRLGYSGLSAIDTTVWLPFVMTRNTTTDWGSVIWAQNTSTTGTTVSVDFYDEDQLSPRLTISQAVSGRGLALFNLRTNHYGLGWGWYGSARVRANQRLAVVVNQFKDNQTLGASYEGVPASAGTTTVILPKVVRPLSGCYYSNFTVRNLGGSSASVTIRYYNAGGSLVTSSNDTVVSHRVYNLYTGTPDGQAFPTPPFDGSVVVASTNGQPIAATSNLLDYCGSSPTDTVSFTGINR